jgi:hypothetical protein
MTATPEILDPAPDTESIPVAGASAPTLITGHEVAFSSGAARVRPVTRWWTRASAVVRAAMHRRFLTAAGHTGAPRQDCARRYEFLERSCLAREMDRL